MYVIQFTGAHVYLYKLGGQGGGGWGVSDVLHVWSLFNPLLIFFFLTLLDSRENGRVVLPVHLLSVPRPSVSSVCIMWVPLGVNCPAHALCRWKTYLCQCWEKLEGPRWSDDARCCQLSLGLELVFGHISFKTTSLVFFTTSFLMTCPESKWRVLIPEILMLRWYSI